MKLKYIDINGHGILVDDSAGEIGSIRLEYMSNIGNPYTRIYDSINGSTIMEIDKIDKGRIGFTYEIIFAEKELNIDVPVLPNWREWEVEQEYLKYEKKIYKEYINFNNRNIKEHFIAGYNHNKAKYTEEDIREAYRRGSNYEIMGYNPDEFIQSLQKFPKFIVMDNGIIKEIVY